MTVDYLINRPNLMCLFVLIDCRHKPQKIDQEFMQWLAKNKIPFVIVFTKTDKVKKNTLNQNIKLYKKEMLKEWKVLPESFTTSAEKKEGTENILNFIGILNPQFKPLI